MEQKYQTSFIPKKPVVTSEQSKSVGINLFLLVSIVVFLLSLGLAGYVYLSKSLLIQKISTAQKSISDNKSGLVSESSTIESLVELNSRIIVAKDLLSKHVSISPIFNFLQLATLKNVRFKNFSFDTKDAVNGVLVQMSGTAQDWETVASQADQFGSEDWRKIISEPKITNLSLNLDGSVSFMFTANVSPDFLNFGKQQL